MDKRKLRRDLLKGMCYWAEEIPKYYEPGHVGIFRFANQVFPVAFKPGVSDKMLFNEIIDEHLECILNDQEEWKKISEGRIKAPLSTIALDLMNKYWNLYGEWVRIPLIELKERRIEGKKEGVSFL